MVYGIKHLRPELEREQLMDGEVAVHSKVPLRGAKSAQRIPPQIALPRGTAVCAWGRGAERANAHGTVEAAAENGAWRAIQGSTAGIIAAVQIERNTRHNCRANFRVVGQIGKVRDVYIHRRRRADLKNALKGPSMQRPFCERRLHAERRR